ncbi:hypothetical protein D3C81_1437850 [compost metagenome]
MLAFQNLLSQGAPERSGRLAYGTFEYNGICGSRLEQRILIDDRSVPALLGRDKPRSHLDSFSTKSVGSHPAATVPNSSRSDDRYSNRIDYFWNKHDSPYLVTAYVAPSLMSDNNDRRSTELFCFLCLYPGRDQHQDMNRRRTQHLQYRCWITACNRNRRYFLFHGGLNHLYVVIAMHANGKVNTKRFTG